MWLLYAHSRFNMCIDRHKHKQPQKEQKNDRERSQPDEPPKSDFGLRQGCFRKSPTPFCLMAAQTLRFQES